MVLVAIDEIRRLGGDLDEVGAVPGAAEGDCRLAEEHVDVGRNVRLPGTALLRLLDEPDDRRVAGRELLLRRGRPDEARQDECRERGEAEDPCTEGRATHRWRTLTHCLPQGLRPRV